MPLTVLSVAYPFAPVGPDSVGGAEQVLSHLDRALVQAGHRSLVVAREDSAVAGELYPVPAAPGPIDEDTRAGIHGHQRRAIETALRDNAVDLVHLHGIDFDRYLPPPGVPALVTVHLPPDWYPEAALRPARPRTYLHGVSQSQHGRFPPGVPVLPPIPNGVPVEALAARHAKRGFALCLGRICPEKGFHHALDAAKLAGSPLLLAGEVFPYPVHEDYFRSEIEPRLDRSRRFIGPVGFRRKRRLLTAARCLVVPSLAPETSSLVAMEALACGTPVVAFPAGALPEVVEHGRTGFLVADERGMADAIRAASGLSSDDCRAAARERFDLKGMIARYFDLYRQVAA
ncbi:glycosyltransferase (plasmid) [Skermanella mucosa]|uniref:glycosyltransferase n=1 Tax=Skermanella mucosa TaxID=1789672 RepID=UPI00192B8BBC|nr:glycosyltransferase [Skermanella mucosa]UEM25373.1 glycosyltransferase [Skermanella mucosa]